MAESPATGLRTHILPAITFMCVASLILPLLNAAAKHLGDTVPVLQIVWGRYAGHLIYMMVVFLPSRGSRLLSTRRPGVQVTRSFLLLLCTALYFWALRHLSLPTAAAINFTSPLIVTLLAIPMLGEQVGVRRWFAAIFGFIGALVIIRPGMEGTHWAGFLVLGTAISYAFYQILTRKVSAFDSAETTHTWTAVVGTAVTTVFLPFVWVTPASGFDWLVFLSLGLTASVGHYLIVRAYQLGSVSVLSPFSYLQLVGAAILGYALFGDVPDTFTWLGAGMIVASGLYTIYREAVRRQEADT